MIKIAVFILKNNCMLLKLRLLYSFCQNVYYACEFKSNIEYHFTLNIYMYEVSI